MNILTKFKIKRRSDFLFKELGCYQGGYIFENALFLYLNKDEVCQALIKLVKEKKTPLLTLKAFETIIGIMDVLLEDMRLNDFKFLYLQHFKIIEEITLLLFSELAKDPKFSFFKYDLKKTKIFKI